MSLDTLLVANRGEIACRIFRTARSMGIRCVAVFVEADEDAPFVREADKSIRLDSYLNAEAIVAEAATARAAELANAEAIDAKQKQLIAEGRTGPQDHAPSRPRSVEAGGVRHLCEFARRTGAHVYIVHTSCKQAVDEANAARARGVEVFVEAVAPHLVLDCTYAARPDFEGAKWVMSPPLRDAVEPGNLWAAMGRGVIVSVGTDHAPFNFHGQ